MLGSEELDTGAANGAPTIIISGIGRSGTSMIAAIVQSLGIAIRTDGSAVHEDPEFNAALLYFDYARLTSLIESRNHAGGTWGFKFPSLQNHLFPAQLSLFRNPHLIVVTRDIAGACARAIISDPEYRDEPIKALQNIATQTLGMMQFLHDARCPVMLLSYEKTIRFPDTAINMLAEFCGVPVPDEARSRARGLIQPNNPSYIALFHPTYRGHVNGLRGKALIGWCSATTHNEPVEVEILVDGALLGTTLANLFRQDLLEAGIGAGRHAFTFNLDINMHKPSSIVSVRTENGAYLLDGSNRTIQQLSDTG